MGEALEAAAAEILALSKRRRKGRAVAGPLSVAPVPSVRECVLKLLSLLRHRETDAAALRRLKREGR